MSLADTGGTGTRRIIYLGGLGGEGPLPVGSPCAVDRKLPTSFNLGVPVIEFRASIVIGSGSLSFEMIRALTQRYPCIVCPRWVAVKAQPIAIERRDCLPLASLGVTFNEGAMFSRLVVRTRLLIMARSCGSTPRNPPLSSLDHLRAGSHAAPAAYGWDWSPSCARIGRR